MTYFDAPLARFFAIACAAMIAATAIAPGHAQDKPAPAKAANPSVVKAEKITPGGKAESKTPDTVEAEAKELELNARQIPLGAALKSRQLWQQYKGRFVTAQGRVVDSANGMISHSEGQGYGMLLAVAANDRETFDRIWGWTRANLMVRDDVLMAWRWEPGQRPAVSDMNNATDGDILVAWALTEAAELWAELSYRIAARRLAVEVGRKVVLFKQKPGALVLPAVAGFAADERRDGPVINLSYYVFPAFARLPIVAPEYDWSGISQGGLDILRHARFGTMQLPTEWISVREGKLKPAAGFAPRFSYNAIRIPLYMAWAGIGDRIHYEPFFAWGQTSGTAVSIVDVKRGKSVQKFQDHGYSSVARLLQCLPDNGKISPATLTLDTNQHYYPSTLHLLTVLAIEMRYASCVR